MNLQEIGSRALRAAIQQNRVSFPAQAPVFRKHSRSDVQWRMSVLYFVRGWSIRSLSDRYNICSARVQQLLSSWRKYAVSASYIQEIPPEGAPEVPAPTASVSSKWRRIQSPCGPLQNRSSPRPQDSRSGPRGIQICSHSASVRSRTKDDRELFRAPASFRARRQPALSVGKIRYSGSRQLSFSR